MVAAATTRARSVAAAIVLALLLAAVDRLHAQGRIPGETAVDREIERLIVEGSDEESDHDVEELLWLRRHPLELRRATWEELARLPSIDPQAAIAIIEVVRHLQPRDLRALAGSLALTPRQLVSLRAFTTLSVDTLSSVVRGAARVRIERDLVDRRGAAERLHRIVASEDRSDTIDVGAVWRGAPESMLLQLALERGPVSLAAVVASDRGEPIIHRDTVGLSYSRLERVADTATLGSVRTRVAAHAGLGIAWQQPWLTVVLGDFSADLGQGLVLADGRRRFSRSGGAATAYVAARRLAPNRSSDESAYLRGLGTELIVERPLPFRARLLALASWRWLDATTDTGNDGSPRVASIDRDGARRTVGEIRRIATALEQLRALNVGADTERWAFGVSWTRSDLRAEGARESARREALAIDGRFGGRCATAYAEVAIASGRVAAVAGFVARAGSSILAAALRTFPVGIELPHGRAFPRSGPVSAERGLFVAVESSPLERLRCTLSVDLADRPVPSSTIPFPHLIGDTRLCLTWTPRRATRIEVRAEHVATAARVTESDLLGRTHRGLSLLHRTRLGFTAGFEASPDLSLRARFDLRIADREAVEPGERSLDRGWATTLDLRASVTPALDISGGIAIFDVPDDEVALHAVEADLPGRVRSSYLGGSGCRLFAAARWTPLPALRLSASLAQAAYIDRRTIGSGLDEIDGPRSLSGALQLDWRFGD